jgi:hypothetical protein
MYVPSVELLLVIGGGAGVLAFGFNPALVLLAGGCIGAVLIRQFESEDHA